MSNLKTRKKTEYKLLGQSLDKLRLDLLPTGGKSFGQVGQKLFGDKAAFPHFSLTIITNKISPLTLKKGMFEKILLKLNNCGQF